MDTHQIGLFISRCRKEKNMTQKQLADIVGVSDKSVSKWERGINLPESSLFIPLCEVLDIQVQELLLGEHIEQKELLQKSNETSCRFIKTTRSRSRNNSEIYWIFHFISNYIYFNYDYYTLRRFYRNNRRL